MELVLGGAWQGKLTWTAKTYGLESEDLCDLALCDPVPGKRCYYHLEALTRRHADCSRFFPCFQNAIVIAREIGSGVVPLDAEMRAWRERHGSFLQKLAQESAHVTRIFCGLPEVLK